METTIELVTVTAVNGKSQVFEVVEGRGDFRGTRAYIKDSSGYYDMDVFERGLKSPKVASVTRLAMEAK